MIAQGGALDFEALQLGSTPLRRGGALAKESPASVVFFDEICEGDRNLRASRSASAAERSSGSLPAPARRST